MTWVCFFRLHWLFDHAIGYNDDRTKWVCKSCKTPVSG